MINIISAGGRYWKFAVTVVNTHLKGTRIVTKNRIRMPNFSEPKQNSLS
jgi:hypothetical protein